MTYEKVSIVHAGGTRVLDYVIPAVQRQMALRAGTNRGGEGSIVTGDGFEQPAAYTITVLVEAGSLQAAYTLAYSIISEAETATLVTAHWPGAQAVDGLLGYRMEPGALRVRLTLDFAATQPLMREEGMIS